MRFIKSDNKNKLFVIILFLMSFVSLGMKNYISIDTKEILTSLERKMSKIDTIQTKFTQTKDLALFNQIIEIKGSLFLKKPHMFAWHIDSPLKQTILLEDNRIKQWDEDTNKVQTFSLSENPSFNIAIEQMSRWVSGEYLSLTDEYVIEILKKKPIQLKFTPLENAMVHSFIDSITIFFQDDEKYIKEIIIQESSGDTTSFTFFDTLLNVDLDSAVWKVRTRE